MLTEAESKDAGTEHIDDVTPPSIFMERSGKGSRALAEKLVEPSEYPLSPEEKEIVLLYEAFICEYKLDETLSLETWIRTHSIGAARFYAGAFLNDQIHIDGLEDALRQLKSSGDVYSWLARCAKDETLTPVQFREIARQSTEYYKTEMQQAVLRDERPSEELFDSRSIVIEPQKALRYARAAMQARNFLLSERAKYSSTSHDINSARRAFVDIYLKRVNGIVVGDISLMGTLFKQAEMIDDDETAIQARRILPSTLRDAILGRNARANLGKRFDYIRNGIGYDENGLASAVDAALFITTDQEPVVESPAPVFSKEQREQLREAYITKEDIHQVFKSILAEARMLSSEHESTWYPGRGHRAEDQLFQVVYQPIKNTFSVNGVDGVILTPNKERSVYDILTVGAHELTHINQIQADLILHQTLRIGRLKGRRVRMLRETGANIAQRKLEQELFGQSKPVAYAYAKAIQAFESGGDRFDATKAFYNEKIQTNPGLGRVAAAAEATDRVLRLGTTGNNSAALSYAEENIMNSELHNAAQPVRERATKITTLDLDDQLRLHTYGLLPEIEQNSIDWTPILMKFIWPFIEEAFSR